MEAVAPAPVLPPEPSLPEGVLPAAETWGQLTAFNRWLVEHLRLDEAFERVERAGVETAKRPESPAEAMRHRAEQVEEAERRVIDPALVIRTLADEDAALDLANILFRKNGGDLEKSDYEAIPREALFSAFFTCAAASPTLTRGLLGLGIGSA